MTADDEQKEPSRPDPSDPPHQFIGGVSVTPSPAVARTGTSGSSTVEPVPVPENEARRVQVSQAELEIPDAQVVRARQEATIRPVEVLLRDPLSEVARKERRSLLGVSAIAILVGSTGLVPEKIENLGISFSHPERAALLLVFMAVVIYYTVAFITYAMNDFLSYRHAVHVGRQEIRRQQLSTQPPPPPPGYSGSPAPQPPTQDAPWRMIELVSPVSIARGIFDFAVPLAVAVYAIVTLYGATHLATQPKAPPPVKVAPQSGSQKGL